LYIENITKIGREVIRMMIGIGRKVESGIISESESNNSKEKGRKWKREQIVKILYKYIKYGKREKERDIAKLMSMNTT